MKTISYSSNASFESDDALDLRKMGVYGPNRHSILANLDKWILKDAVNAMMTATMKNENGNF